MMMLYPKSFSQPSECPYIGGKSCRFEFFFAADLSPEELELHLSQGWRTFGLNYFRPVCGCTLCIPIRIPCGDFEPSKSQRRVMRKNADVEISVTNLRYTPEILEIYNEHSCVRFGKEPESEETFLEQFYTPSCPGAQSEFRIGGKLVGVGFLNISHRSISSVYFVYRDGLLDRSFGIFSMLAEIEFAKKYGFDFYYPGYWVKECGRMKYKGGFLPREVYDWETGIWSKDREEEIQPLIRAD